MHIMIRSCAFNGVSDGNIQLMGAELNNMNALFTVVIHWQWLRWWNDYLFFVVCVCDGNKMAMFAILLKISKYCYLNTMTVCVFGCKYSLSSGNTLKLLLFPSFQGFNNDIYLTEAITSETIEVLCNYAAQWGHPYTHLLSARRQNIKDNA